jgi:hypothetical protein
MAPRKTKSAVAPTRDALKRSAPKTKDQSSESGKRGSTRSIHLRNDMTIANGQQRIRVIRLFCESRPQWMVGGQRVSVGLSLNKHPA